MVAETKNCCLPLLKWHGWQYKFRTLLIRAYESNTQEKLRNFLSVEPQLVVG
jgi:hypothetical protein